MTTDPLAYFEERLRDEFEGAELWDADERMDAVPAEDMADYILDSMLTCDQDIADYFYALPTWFEFENVFTGTVNVGTVSAWAVSEYCRRESDFLAELIENGF